MLFRSSYTIFLHDFLIKSLTLLKSFLPAVILAVRAFPAGVLGNAAVRHIHLALRYLEESGGSVISGGVATSVSLVRVLLAIGVYFHVGLLFQCGGGYMPATDIVPSNALECEFPTALVLQGLEIGRASCRERVSSPV